MVLLLLCFSLKKRKAATAVSTIVPPVTIGYCTVFGTFAFATSCRNPPIPATAEQIDPNTIGRGATAVRSANFFSRRVFLFSKRIPIIPADNAIMIRLFKIVKFSDVIAG